jgi:Zn-dependent protease
MKFFKTIPITIQSWFWVMAALIGWLNSQSVIGILIWIGIVFVSVLFHEFGHAFTALAFRQNVQIHLVALGGLTSYVGPKLSFPKQFLIVLNGPLAGIGLFFIATLLLNLPIHPQLLQVIQLIQVVNLFWSIVNLLPVLPLDGGQLLRIALEGFFGVKGFKASLLIGMIIALLVSFYFFLIQAFLVGAFFFLFAFQSFDGWRKSRRIIASDREEEVKCLFEKGEQLLQNRQKEEAAQVFEQVGEKAPGGMLAATAAQYLAFLYVEEKKNKKAYQLLLPLQKELSPESIALLHRLAEEEGNASLVAELSVDCYQHSPNQEVAIRNAKAFAFLNHPQRAGGWIQTAWQHGSFDLQALLAEPPFERVRENPQFRCFVDRLI